MDIKVRGGGLFTISDMSVAVAQNHPKLISWSMVRNSHLPQVHKPLINRQALNALSPNDSSWMFHCELHIERGASTHNHPLHILLFALSEVGKVILRWYITSYVDLHMREGGREGGPEYNKEGKKSGQ